MAPSNSAGDALKLKTVANFSYEWKRFNKMLPIYETNHRLYFQPRGKEFFAGKLGLDAGCGTGRHVYYAAKYGAEMVAIDLSDAVEVAYENTRSFANVHVAQADIYDLPFKRDYFDFVESVGVIHILPDPKAAFEGLVKLLRPGGEIYMFVYSTNVVDRGIKQFIKGAYENLGRMLPSRALYAYCFAAAAIGRTWNVPMRLLQKWKPTRSLATKLIAFDSYEIYPFYMLHTDLFDWIGTPLNRYYTLDDVRSFYIDGPFDRVEIQEAEPQWRVFARKALDSGSKFLFNSGPKIDSIQQNTPSVEKR
jgi:SAM-dependent methyltransferase